MNKDCQIQLEQTMSSKDLSPYSAMSERARSSGSSTSGGKSRPSRSKARRSPYPQYASGTETPEAGGQEIQDKTFPDYLAACSTAGADVSAGAQNYHSMMYGPHAADNMERYNALYSTPYPHPGVAMYRDAACVYSYPAAAAAHQRYLDDRSPYRGYEERYYPARDPAAYPGYLSSNAAIQSAAVVATNTRLCQEASAALSRDSGGGVGVGVGGGGGQGGSGVLVGGQSYASDFRSAGQCSRSSSRDDPSYVTQSYAAPFSNRSESSASEVDVCSSEEYEKQRQSGAGQGPGGHRASERPSTSTTSKFESLMDTGLSKDSVAYNKRHEQQSGSGTTTLQALSPPHHHHHHQQQPQQQQQQQQHHQQGTQRESAVPHPVIMRRRSSAATYSVSSSSSSTATNDSSIVTNGTVGGGGSGGGGSSGSSGGAGGNTLTDYNTSNNGNSSSTITATAFNHKSPSTSMGTGASLPSGTELRSGSVGPGAPATGQSGPIKPSALPSGTANSSSSNNLARAVNGENSVHTVCAAVGGGGGLGMSAGSVGGGGGGGGVMGGGGGAIGHIMPSADSYLSANDKLHSMRLGMGVGMGMGMGMGATQDYSQCLKAAAYGYDNYSPAASMYGGAAATLQAQRSYPVMPQPGYTSVIVDPQQYHVANGYAVH